MSQPLLLDEMFTDDIAQQLRTKGYDVISVVADPALVGRPDDQILAYATTEGRTLVTANIKDFVPLDTRYRAADQSHAVRCPAPSGLRILTCCRSEPQEVVCGPFR
jgi:predicted nuclease of predicted toxin-antitoxin system